MYQVKHRLQAPISVRKRDIWHWFPCGADGRTDRRTAMWPPKFFRCTDNQILLAKVFYWERESSAKNSSYAGFVFKNKLRKEKQL